MRRKGRFNWIKWKCPVLYSKEFGPDISNVDVCIGHAVSIVETLNWEVNG